MSKEIIGNLFVVELELLENCYRGMNDNDMSSFLKTQRGRIVCSDSLDFGNSFPQIFFLNKYRTISLTKT